MLNRKIVKGKSLALPHCTTEERSEVNRTVGTYRFCVTMNGIEVSDGRRETPVMSPPARPKAKPRLRSS